MPTATVDKDEQKTKPKTSPDRSFKTKTCLSEMLNHETSCYGLSYAQAVPGNGVVYVGATNGRGVAIEVCDGHLDKRRLVPHEVLPTNKKHYDKKDNAVKIELDSDGKKWLSSFKTWGEDGTEDCRYPKLGDHVMYPDDSKVTVFGLQPKLLKQVADALNTKGDGSFGCDEHVWMIVPHAGPNGKDDILTGVIRIVGEHGIGVVMPCGGEGVSRSKILAEFNKIASAYMEAEERALNTEEQEQRSEQRRKLKRSRPATAAEK